MRGIQNKRQTLPRLPSTGSLAFNSSLLCIDLGKFAYGAPLMVQKVAFRAIQGGTGLAIASAASARYRNNVSMASGTRSPRSSRETATYVHSFGMLRPPDEPLDAPETTHSNIRRCAWPPVLYVCVVLVHVRFCVLLRSRSRKT